MIYFESEQTLLKEGSYHQKHRNLQCGTHLHDSFELFYVYEGEITAVVNGISHSLHRGEAILVFPNFAHSYHTPTHSHSAVCVFSTSAIGEFAEKIRGLSPTNPVLSIHDDTLPQRLREAEPRRYRFKCELYALIDRFESGTEYLPRSSRSSERMEQLLLLIAKHYDKPITMKDAAKQIGYDHHYLSNLLQKELGTTFRQLLNEYRIARTANLLISTDTSISQIASQCGYASLCSFNRNFRQIIGMTPGEYRKKRRKHRN